MTAPTAKPLETALEAVAEATTTPANDKGTKSAPAAREGGGKNKGGRPPKEHKPTPWTIKGVDVETRAVLTKAAERTDKTLGEYFNTAVREFAQGQVKRSATPPASPQDVAEMVKAQLVAMRSELAADVVASIAPGIEEAVKKATANDPNRRGLFARWFGTR